MIHQLGQAQALKAVSENHVGEHTDGTSFDQAIMLAGGVLVGR